MRTLVDRAAIEIGERWRVRLEDLITRAETILFVLSPESVNSKVCAEEVAFGKRLGKRFIPVIARPVDAPSVPETLSELNYVCLADGEPYAANVDRLVSAIRTDLAWCRTHADLGRLAEEWTKAGRPRGLLLSSARLTAAEHWLAGRPAHAPLPTDDTRDLIGQGRRAANQWRNGLSAALALGLILALGLAGLALSQRQIAERQTDLARRREGEAQEQRDAARRNFDIARGTIDRVTFDLAQGLRRVEGIRLSVLRTVLSRAEAAVNQLSDAAPDDPNVQRSRAVMLDEFGDTYIEAGDGTAAARAHQEGLEIFRALVRRDPGNAQWQRDLTVSLERIGDLKLRVGDAPSALAAYQESLESRRAFVRLKPDDAQGQRDVSTSLSKIGDLRFQAGESEKALAAQQESLDISRALVRRDPDDVQSQRDLSLGLERIGAIKFRAGDAKGALIAYQEVLEIRRVLVGREPDDTQLRRDLFAAVVQVADVMLEVSDVQGAVDAYELSMDIARDLARRDPENSQWQSDLATSLVKIGDLMLRAGEFRGAVAAHQESLDIRRVLARRDPGNTQLQRDVAISIAGRGGDQIASGDLSAALGSLEESLAIFRRLATADPTNHDLSKDIRLTVGDLGDLAQHALLARDFEKALRAADTGIEASPDALWLHSKRAHALMLLGRLDEARALYLKYRGRAVYDDMAWDRLVTEDFTAFRKAGIANVLMDELETTFAGER